MMAEVQRSENLSPGLSEFLGRLQDSIWVEVLSPSVMKSSRTEFPQEAPVRWEPWRAQTLHVFRERMGGEIGLPHFEWKANCFLESCFQPNEDHTEEKAALPWDGS